jgi:hypothetical protein
MFDAKASQTDVEIDLTISTELCAQLACISGPTPSASLAADGRRIPIGTPIRENDDLSNERGEAVLESLGGSRFTARLMRPSQDVRSRFSQQSALPLERGL